jgi:hypothetical protein
MTTGTNAASYARIWGVPISDIAQAKNLNPTVTNNNIANIKNITISGGMGVGLPLANSAQSGILLQGSIYQAFANWIGVDMTLELQMAYIGSTTSAGTPYNIPTNIIFNYKAGGSVSDALKQTLSTALPNVKQDIQISPNLVWNHDEQGYYATLPQFADAFKKMTSGMLGANYPGVDIAYVPQGPTVRAYDGTQTQSQSSSTKQISFVDLVGQPTWIAPGQVQATCVMRADIQVADQVTLPPGLVTTTPEAMSQFSQIRQGSIFTGSFLVTAVRHVGNYKSPSAQNWVTVLNLTSTTGV